eukprot:COSAG05_NODE_28244_length_130_cov_17.354839_1_plen_23_part_01
MECVRRWGRWRGGGVAIAWECES